MDSLADLRLLLLPYFTEDELAGLTRDEMQVLAEALPVDLPDIGETEQRRGEEKYRDRMRHVFIRRSLEA